MKIPAPKKIVEGLELPEEALKDILKGQLASPYLVDFIEVEGVKDIYSPYQIDSLDFRSLKDIKIRLHYGPVNHGRYKLITKELGRRLLDYSSVIVLPSYVTWDKGYSYVTLAIARVY